MKHTTRAAALLAALTLCAASAWAAMSDAEFLSLCEYGTADQVRQALKDGANPNARAEGEPLEGGDILPGGQTPLMIAARSALAVEVGVIEALLAAGADPNAKDEEGLTALMHAASCGGGGQEMERGAPERVGALLAGGAEVDARDTSGDTALIRAATLCHAETVRALLTGGADVNAVNNSGETALMRAAQPRMHGDVTPIVAVLLEAGAGAFSAADLKRMSTFVSNFVEVLVLPDFDMQKGDAPSNPALIYFGVVHNAINNFKSRVKDKDCQVENCEHGSTVIEAKFVVESVRKYFDLNPKHQSHDGGEEGTGFLHFDGKLYHFFWGDGEIRPYAKVKRAVREGGAIRMTGDIYTEDEMDNRPPEIIATFTVTAKPHKWNGKDTWAILSLKRERR